MHFTTLNNSYSARSNKKHTTTIITTTNKSSAKQPTNFIGKNVERRPVLLLLMVLIMLSLAGRPHNGNGEELFKGHIKINIYCRQAHKQLLLQVYYNWLWCHCFCFCFCFCCFTQRVMHAIGVAVASFSCTALLTYLFTMLICAYKHKRSTLMSSLRVTQQLYKHYIYTHAYVDASAYVSAYL